MRIGVDSRGTGADSATHIVYGSAALGYLSTASDIDVLRVLDTAPTEHLPMRVDSRLGSHSVSLYTITRSDLDQDASAGKYGGYYALKLLNPVYASSLDFLGTLSVPLQFLSNVEKLGPKILRTEEPRAAVRLMIEGAIQMYPAFAASLIHISRDQPAWHRYWEVQESRLINARRATLAQSERLLPLPELQGRFFQHGAEMHSYGSRFRQIYNSKASGSVVGEVRERLR